MVTPTPSRRAMRTRLTLLAPLVLAACGGGSSGAAPALTAEAAQAYCRALPASHGLAATSLTTTYVPADTQRPAGATSGAYLPGHCVVRGAINPRTGVDGKPYAIGFELSLPDSWNGRFLYLGGGGNDGTLRATSLSSSISGGTPSPLGQGYAVVSTDAGHSGTSADFALDPQARIDHAYNAHDKTAISAKALIQARYGRRPDHSYFSGCSGGGRQGMMFSQRFPDYFDGITAGAPAMRVSSGATVAAMWNNQKLTAIAPRNAAGAPILSRAFSDADLQLTADAVKAACDTADGARDGMVQNVNACRFDPAVLQCSGEKAANCLSAAQVGALKDVFGGPRTSAGKALYAGQPWDPGLAASGWRDWTLGNSTTTVPDSRYNTLMADALVREFFTPPDPGFDILRFDFDTDPARMTAFSAVYDTYADASLSAYRQRGGKLLFIHGMADPIFSAQDTIDYYARLTTQNGGRSATEGFARLMLVPGMNHCSGGPATDSFDAVQAMVDWVEKGVAPERLAAAAKDSNVWFPNRTRPLCAYPRYARYNGSGSLEDSASFTCVEP